MGFDKDTLGMIARKLIDHGVDFVVIGDTTVQLALGYEEMEGDIDLFVLNPSPLVERDFYEELAEKNNWSLSTTELGTISLLVPTRHGDVIVELYENYMDIDIPLEILEDKVEYKIAGVKVYAIRPEYYLVLKARQGVDVDKLSSYIDQLRKQRKLNQEIVKQAIMLYPRDESDLIANRLRSIGLEVHLD